MEMTKRKQYYYSFSQIVILVAAVVVVSCCHGYAISSDAKLIRTCNNGSTIAECEAEINSDEFEMDSEIHHRLLQQSGGGTKSIGYGALDPDRAACKSGNGKAYSDCVPHRNGNPPTRGCRPYEQCRT